LRHRGAPRGESRQARFPVSSPGTLRSRNAARDYFMKEPQALFDFVRQQSFQDQALERGGYDATEAGAVRLVN
jgi:hypothetical protein